MTIVEEEEGWQHKELEEEEGQHKSRRRVEEESMPNMWRRWDVRDTC